MNAPLNLVIPPHSIEAEQAVVGALLLHGPAAWDRIADAVAESDFYRDDHRRIFSCIGRMVAAGRAVDVITINDELTARNETDQTGGLAYLAELANAVVSIANVRAYAAIVADKAMRRRLILTAREIEALAFGQGDARSAMDSAQRLLADAADTGARRSEPEAIQATLGRVIEDIEARYASESEIAGMPTGFVDLDRQLSGLHPGDLIIVAGRPSMGKTALALNIAENVAIESRKPALVFSLEMSKVQLATRSLASVGTIPIQRLRNGRLEDPDWERLTMALGKLHDAPIIIDDCSGLSVAQMIARARRQARRGGLGLIVIDYLQLMDVPGDKRNSNRAADLGDITRALKLMARELSVPVVALSQLSRKVEERNDKRPLMSDLRESGAIEQDADVILMVYRDEYYRADSPHVGTAEIIIAKQRMGATGDVRLAFQGEYGRFRDLAPGDMSRFNHERAQAKMAASRRRGLDDD